MHAQGTCAGVPVQRKRPGSFECRVKQTAPVAKKHIAFRRGASRATSSQHAQQDVPAPTGSDLEEDMADDMQGQDHVSDDFPEAMSGHYAGSLNASQAPPREHLSNQQRKANEAGSWAQLMQTAAEELHWATMPGQVELQQAIHTALQAQLVAAVTTGHCSKCGLRTADCDVVRYVTVCVVDIASCHTVEVPVYRCSRCVTAWQTHLQADEPHSNSQRTQHPQPQPVQPPPAQQQQQQQTGEQEQPQAEEQSESQEQAQAEEQQQQQQHGEQQQQQQQHGEQELPQAEQQSEGQEQAQAGQQQQQPGEQEQAREQQRPQPQGSQEQPPAQQQQQPEGQQPEQQQPERSGVFNLHPFAAGCFPATPQHGVNLACAATGSLPIWFTVRLLQDVLVQRQHIQRMAVHKAAAAKRAFLQDQPGSNHLLSVSPDRFSKSFATALERYAELQLRVTLPQALTLPREGLVDCCAVCSNGHSDLLQQQGVVVVDDKGVPFHHAAVTGDAGPAAKEATDEARGVSAPEEFMPDQQHDSEPPSTAAEPGPGSPDEPAGQEQPTSRQPFVAAIQPRVVHTVMFDGLQKLRHLRKAGRVTGRVPVYFERLLDDLQFALWDASPDDDGPVDLDPCNTFRADRALGRRSEMFDISGIVTAVCRHGFLLAAINMPTGERWAFARYLIHTLVHEHKIWPYITMYDINCRFKPHLHKWLLEQSEWSAAERAWVLAMPCPLPPFHVHMHAASCQAKNSLNLVPAAGLGSGEPTEILNSYLAVAGVVLQYATLSGRALWLEVFFRAWNARKQGDLPSLLVRMGYKAFAKCKQLQERQEMLAVKALEQQPAPSVDEVVSWGECSASPVDAAQGPPALPWAAEAAELLIQLNALRRDAGQELLPIALVRVEIGDSIALSSREERLAKLKQRHPDISTWGARSDAMKHAVALLCTYKVEHLQHELGRLSRLYTYTRWLQKWIGDVSRKEHRKLDAELQRLRAKLRRDVARLVQWDSQQLCYSQYMDNQSPGDGSRQRQQEQQQQQQQRQQQGQQEQQQQQPAGHSSAHQQQAPPTPSWRNLSDTELVQSLAEGVLPWCEVQGQHSLAGIRRLMGLGAYDMRAALQEAALVQYEVGNYTASMQRKQQQLCSTVQELQCEREQHLQTASSLDQPPCTYSRFCSAQTARLAAAKCAGRVILLQRMIQHSDRELQAARLLFGKYRSSVGDGEASSGDAAAAATEGAAAALFAELGAEPTMPETDQDADPFLGREEGEVVFGSEDEED